MVASGGITGDGSTTLPTGWQLIDGYLIGPAANLGFVNLAGVDLGGANLTDAYLAGATLTGVLNGAHLNGAYLMGADLSGADLTGVIGAAKYNSATILPAGFDPVAAGWTLVS